MSLTTRDVLETIARLNRDSDRPNHPLYRALETGGLNRKQVQYVVKTDAERKLVIDVARRSNKIRRLMYDEVWDNMPALR